MIGDTQIRLPQRDAVGHGTGGWTTMTAQEALAQIRRDLARHPIPLAIQSYEMAAMIARYAEHMSPEDADVLAQTFGPYQTVGELQRALPALRAQMFDRRPRVYIQAD
jgi:hypothetical protein